MQYLQNILYGFSINCVVGLCWSYYDLKLQFISGRRQRHKYLALTAYDRHKLLVNEYLLNYSGATELLKRDTSKDKSDIDVIRENHRFLWDEVDETNLTWDQQLAKKYYEKVKKLR